MRFLSDEDFDQRIIRGVLRRLPRFDMVRAQETTGRGTPDPEVLEYAAHDRRIVLTHDVNTMLDAAYKRSTAGLPMPGVFVVNRFQPIGAVVESVVLVVEGSVEGEWEGQVIYLPFK